MFADPIQWQLWSESSKIISLPVITSPSLLKQLNLTNDETIYLWYRRNVTLNQTSKTVIAEVETRISNALLFFLDSHQRQWGVLTAIVPVDLSHFKPNQQYLFEILSISLGIDCDIGPHAWLDEELLFDNVTVTNF